jgi:hypothetical protein
MPYHTEITKTDDKNIKRCQGGEQSVNREIIVKRMRRVLPSETM